MVRHFFGLYLYLARRFYKNFQCTSRGSLRCKSSPVKNMVSRRNYSWYYLSTTIHLHLASFYVKICLCTILMSFMVDSWEALSTSRSRFEITTIKQQLRLPTIKNKDSCYICCRLVVFPSSFFVEHLLYVNFFMFETKCF